MSPRRLALLALLVACGAPSTPVDEPAGPGEADRAAALADAEAAAKQLGGTLKARLGEAMGAGGPAAAAAVCATEAGTLTAGVAAERGATVGRSSLRLRNPDNAGPPWVTEWLEAQGERPADGVAPVDRIDVVPTGEVARVLRPIAVEAPCLACHGPADALADGVPALLAERYPADRAVGYALGDLRGALYAEVPVTVR